MKKLKVQNNKMEALEWIWLELLSWEIDLDYYNKYWSESNYRKEYHKKMAHYYKFNKHIIARFWKLR